MFFGESKLANSCKISCMDASQLTMGLHPDKNENSFNTPNLLNIIA